MASPSRNDATPLLSSLSGALQQPQVQYQSFSSNQPTIDTSAENIADNDALSDTSSPVSEAEGHKTSVKETFLHLVKGYIGVGCLSLPWAVSQLGILNGFIAIGFMSFWSSYNCWTVVKLKRYVEHQHKAREQMMEGDGDDKASDASMVTANTNITYPDVGEWAYGKKFQSIVSACICTQQMAICTVFISFIGENLLAILLEMPIDWGRWESHAGVLTMALPAVMSLSFIPSLKKLAPAMAAGTVLLLGSFAALGVVAEQTWPEEPYLPSFNLKSAPLALCAILYSYEGICLILPIESAMQEPKHFKKVFIGGMSLVAFILGSFASICVYAFGDVTNGSVTAFLIERYEGNASLQWWLMIANTAVSLSVLFTYPMQLFPAVELLGPWFTKTFLRHRAVFVMEDPDEGKEEKDLTGFDPLPMLPEHDTISLEDMMEHHYDEEGQGATSTPAESDVANGFTSIDEMISYDHRPTKRDADADEVSVKSFISSIISFPNQMMPKMVMPGDSPQLRAALVLVTYLVAIVVPNVQTLVSLAGALAGSSSALLIPPILELAWIKHLEGGSLASDTPGEASILSPPSSPFFGKNRPQITLNSKAKEEKKSVVKMFFTKWWMDKVKCYILLIGGVIFALIGTYASLADIYKVYTTSGDVR